MSLSLEQINIGEIGGASPEGYPAKYNNMIQTVNSWSVNVPSNFQTSGLQNEDILSYNTVSAKWENKTLTEGNIAKEDVATLHYAKEVDETNVDATKDKHISNLLAKTYTDHIADTSNPHTVTAIDVGKNIAQWNADEIQSKEVNDAGVADTYSLQYDLATDKIIYALANANRINTITVDNTNIGANKGLIYDGSNLTYVDLNKATSQWNADKVQGVTVDDTNKADGKVLQYDSASGNIIYDDVSVGSISIDGGDSATQGNAIQMRRDSNADYITNNPILDNGEIGYETDTRLLKIGNGTTAWNSLPYFTGGASTAGEANTASNVGAGLGDIFKQKDGIDLQFKTIKQGANIVISNNTDDITISATSSISPIDNTFTIVNSVDATKEIGFDADSITTGTTRKITMPDKDVILINSEDSIWNARVFG